MMMVQSLSPTKNNAIDGVDTLRNIEWGEFKGEREDLGISNLVTSQTQTTSPRIIPLPLEDGVEDIEAEEATDITANPNHNDLSTPPHVALTAPVRHAGWGCRIYA